jgi:hypothetical protein
VAVQATPAEVGIPLANWNWKVVRRFIEERCGVRLSRSSCLRSLHRLGFVFKRPKKRLLKADEAKRAAFVEQYAALLAEAQATGAQIFFVDEAHFRADAELRGKWVLKGEPALVDSTCPRWGEKASYYSAVCLETGEVEAMELSGNSSYLASPDLDLCLVRLPAYSPDFNADEAIWAWAREEVTGNTCLGTKAQVQEKMGEFFAGLPARTAEVQTRCRTKLQAQAEALPTPTADPRHELPHVDPICALV